MPRIDAIASVVQDMEPTLEFYRLLGLEISPDANDDVYVTVDPGWGLKLSWCTEEVERSINPGWETTPMAGRMGITVRCEDATEVDFVYAKIVAVGHEGVIAPFDAQWGSRHCRVLDPDGNPVDLFAPLP